MCIVYNNSSPHQNLPGSSMRKHVFPLQCQPSAICHTHNKKNQPKPEKHVLGDLFWDGGRRDQKTHTKQSEKTNKTRPLKLCCFFCFLVFVCFGFDPILTLQP